MKIAFGIVGILALLMLGIMPTGCIVHKDAAPSRGAELSSLLDGLPLWPERTRAFPPEAWERLISAGREIQKWEPSSLAKALEEYQRSYEGDPQAEIANDGRLYLLMRVIFDLPERSPPHEAMLWNWVTYRTQWNADGTVNAAWPICWRHGDPHLVSGYMGRQGITGNYRAEQEYLHFLRKYHFRHL